MGDGAVSAPAFTSGPWKLREPGFVTVLGMRRHTHSDGGFIDFEGVVASISQCPQREANANLIAAAPCLYEALDRLTMKRHIHVASDNGDICGLCGQDLRSRVHYGNGHSAREDEAFAFAALSKARGK